MKIHQALSHASSHLRQSDTRHLDAELLLAYALNKSREFIITWPKTDLSESELQNFLNLLEQRVLGHPIAYLIGRKAFWDFDLTVSINVLIPRPETELMVELILEHLDTNKHLLADLGTGSGAIALALAKERPDWQLLATDTSEAALDIAKLNAKNLKLSNIKFRQGSWAEALNNEGYDAIISNPPYIDKGDVHLNQGDIRFEPIQALVAEDDGLADLKQIAIQVLDKLKIGAILLLEHGYQQGGAVRQLMEQSGYNDIHTYKDLSGHERVTMARR
ncbi:MAG: peptide chain release factor N(5)-glutamine methyltransferase [Pseudohongiellaceae bacterium]